MGLKEFKILFDNPDAIYYPNQTVTGNVILTLDSTKKIRGIKLSLKGLAHTHWQVQKRRADSHGKSTTVTETVTGNEEYFKAQFYLIGSGSGEEIEVTAGTHTHPFNFVLPPNLPNSFESEYGHIRYTAKATLDRPWKFDQDTKVAFTVVSDFDLNQHQQASEPVQIEKTKTFCCWCCASGPLTVNISLPVRGYVPGQVIPVKVNVENHSGVNVDRIKLMLLKHITYKAGSEVKVEEKNLATVSKGPIRGNETTSYEQTIEVPPLPPSSLHNCGIIDLEYDLRIKACVSGLFHKNLKKDIRIYLGTVPLHNYQISHPLPNADPIYSAKPVELNKVYPPSMPTPSAPEEPASPPPPGFTFYPNLAPPTYMESVNGSTSLRDTEDSEHVIGAGLGFSPKFPVYNFKPLS